MDISVMKTIWIKKAKCILATITVILLFVTLLASCGNNNSSTTASTFDASWWGSSFVICTDGNLWAWGRNSVGQLGDGTNIDRRNPLEVMTDVVAVS